MVTRMSHGSCGDANPNCPCMKTGKCSKTFPKQLSEETTMAEGKYPNYKRCMRPVCATTKAVKYIYKYVYKGADMTMVAIQGETNGESLNEILHYLLARYISPVEACMRLFKHPTQGSTHTVEKLAIHLPGQSSATYRANVSNAQIRRLIRRGDQTTLTSFFMLCLAELGVAGKMLYKDVPTVYRWNKRSKWF
ncbi:Helitron helicase [Phytophthora megakarya]|uniref:Helitron helicase n=1 Tax=Phytophthora megakarya TaxID=4795 RepID=A0A225V3C7_9STRA|nr:Helitron helicase [Phytophthora megakarya]